MPEKIRPSELRNPSPSEDEREMKVIVKEGDTLEVVAKRMVESWEPGQFVSAVYDGIELIAGGSHTPDEIVAQYEKAKAERDGK